MKVVEVVAGVIFDQTRSSVLLALRRPDQHQGNRWEFPGGKREPGEPFRDALSRELAEELGLAITQCRPRSIIEHSYPDKCVRLHFWDVTAFDGTPEGREGQTLQWVPVADLNHYRFPVANQAIVDALIAENRVNLADH